MRMNIEIMYLTEIEMVYLIEIEMDIDEIHRQAPILQNEYLRDFINKFADGD